LQAHENRSLALARYGKDVIFQLSVLLTKRQYQKNDVAGRKYLIDSPTANFGDRVTDRSTMNEPDDDLVDDIQD